MKIKLKTQTIEINTMEDLNELIRAVRSFEAKNPVSPFLAPLPQTNHPYDWVQPPYFSD